MLRSAFLPPGVATVHLLLGNIFRRGPWLAWRHGPTSRPGKAMKRILDRAPSYRNRSRPRPLSICGRPEQNTYSRHFIIPCRSLLGRGQSIRCRPGWDAVPLPLRFDSPCPKYPEHPDGQPLLPGTMMGIFAWQTRGRCGQPLARGERRVSHGVWTGRGVCHNEAISVCLCLRKKRALESPLCG